MASPQRASRVVRSYAGEDWHDEEQRNIEHVPPTMESSEGLESALRRRVRSRGINHPQAPAEKVGESGTATETEQLVGGNAGEAHRDGPQG